MDVARILLVLVSVCISKSPLTIACCTSKGRAVNAWKSKPLGQTKPCVDVVLEAWAPVDESTSVSTFNLLFISAVDALGAVEVLEGAVNGAAADGFDFAFCFCWSWLEDLSDDEVITCN